MAGSDSRSDFIPYGGAVPAVGTSCRVVGFGAHDLGDSVSNRHRYAGTSKISSVWGDDIKVTFGTAIADSGDSGGPLLCGGNIVGTFSCHSDGDYPAHRVEYYERVSSLDSWIKSTIAAWTP